MQTTPYPILTPYGFTSSPVLSNVQGYQQQNVHQQQLQYSPNYHHNLHTPSPVVSPHPSGAVSSSSSSNSTSNSCFASANVGAKHCSGSHTQKLSRRRGCEIVADKNARGLHFSAPSPNQYGAQVVPGEKIEKDGGEKDIAEWDQFTNAEAAFLGPQLWEKTIPCDPDLKLEYMDLDEFLSENNIDDEILKRNLTDGVLGDLTPNKGEDSSSPVPPLTSNHLPFLTSSAPDSPPQMSENSSSSSISLKLTPKALLPHPKERVRKESLADSVSSPPYSGCPDSPVPAPSPTPSEDKRDITGTSASWATRLKADTKSGSGGSSRDPGLGHEGRRSRQKRGKNITNPELSFSKCDLVLASVPGDDFDPRTRAFSEDELKPQPMIKKSRKQQYVPHELKDERYWARRKKNNVAAKRSRDARRTKENQIAMRANFLEKENQNLRQELEKTRSMLEVMKKRLSSYETP